MTHPNGLSEAQSDSADASGERGDYLTFMMHSGLCTLVSSSAVPRLVE